MARKSTMRRVRKGKRWGPGRGFLVTWDVDSANQATAHRLRYFVFGSTVTSGGRPYRYPGFAEKEGVRYIGQSVLFVRPDLRREIVTFLSKNGIDHEVTSASIG
ncbi:MAG: hypothetical protein A3K65_00780 [Euryarchaeota archaeon RBG_16_68_12]|nr:MAG: hypothetical protein A3K65_00780 [Euryarchaeota archaeon RBG_16_68_12]